MTIQNALGFNADADYLSRASNIINFNSAFTVMCWVRFDSFVDYGHIWGAAISATEVNGDWVNSDMMGHDNANPGASRIGACYAGGTPTYEFNTGANFAASTWVHCALVRASATSLALYLNAGGSPTASNTFSVSGRASAGGEYVARLNGAYGTRGRIACLKQWDTNLTTAEISAEMNKAYAVKTASLREVWTFPADGNRYIGSVAGYTWTANGTITDETGPDLDEPAAAATSFPPVRAIRHAYYHF